jgi:L-iditol 2-dehydrogenase
MKAARLYGAKDIRVEEVPTPQPGPGEVLIRVRAVAVCPSDLRIYQDGHASGTYPDHPLIQGHEFAGDITELGPGVEGWALGTRVAVDPFWYCGACDMCQAGHTNLCRKIVVPSFPQRDGALAEYIACPVYSLRLLSEGTTYLEGALVEPLSNAVHAVNLANLEPGQSVVILGAAAMGMSVLLVARALGAGQIAVVEPLEGRRGWPSELALGPVAASYQELADAGLEFDVVFECSGNHKAFNQALLLAKPAARVIIVGVPHPDDVTFNSVAPRRKELTIIFSRRSRESAQAMELLAQGKVDLKAFAVHQFTLEQTQEAFEATAAQPGDMLRAMVIP